MTINTSPEALAELRMYAGGYSAPDVIRALCDALEEARAEIIERGDDREALYKHLVTTRDALKEAQANVRLAMWALEPFEDWQGEEIKLTEAQCLRARDIGTKLAYDEHDRLKGGDAPANHTQSVDEGPGVQAATGAAYSPQRDLPMPKYEYQNPEMPLASNYAQIATATSPEDKFKSLTLSAERGGSAQDEKGDKNEYDATKHVIGEHARDWIKRNRS